MRLLENYLWQLRGETVHGNRQLFLDDVFVAYLLAFFNPVIALASTCSPWRASWPPELRRLMKSCRSSTDLAVHETRRVAKVRV